MKFGEILLPSLPLRNFHSGRSFTMVAPTTCFTHNFLEAGPGVVTAGAVHVWLAAFVSLEGSYRGRHGDASNKQCRKTLASFCNSRFVLTVSFLQQ